jgi:protein phosphatase
MNIEFFGSTDIGRVRKINEDAFALLPEANAMVVCDGMGGHAAGEVASAGAKEVFIRYFAGGPEGWAARLAFNGEETLTPRARHLVRATRLANRHIFNNAVKNASERGMGTTIVAVAFDAGLVCICHVGDSRAYRLRDGKLERLTTDHSLAAELIAQNELTEEEVHHFAERNVITRALGTRPAVEVDIREDAIARGDIYLACSDGLCGFIDDQLIRQILQSGSKDLKTAGDNLIKAANAAGGEDNITITLARVDDAGKPSAHLPQNVTTIPGEDETAAEAINAVLTELARMEPPEEDTQKIPVPGKSKTRADRSTPKSGSGVHRFQWLFWLLLLVIVTAFVFYGGGGLFDSAENREVSSDSPAGETATAASARLIFEFGAGNVRQARVYVDDILYGVAADFAHEGLVLNPGARHVFCVLDSVTVLDSVVYVSEGENRIELFK